MKKLILIFVVLFAFSCNVSNEEYELPNGYAFYRGGGKTNSVSRNHNLLIRGGATDYSFNEDYIFFSVDTTLSKEPRMLSKKLLIYYIHDIKKDTLYPSVNYEIFQNFIRTHKIDEKFDISKRKF